jgi:hypothetical protein
MKRPRLRFTLRSTMAFIAVAALMLGGIPEGMRLGLRLKEEARARQAVVARIQSVLSQSDSWVNTLEIRLAQSDRQPEKDARHEHWLELLAEWRESAASCRRDLPIYDRLARHPWLPFPSGGWDREYLDDNALAYINRHNEAIAALLWSSAGAAAVEGGVLSMVLVFVIATRKLSARERKNQVGSARDSQVR